MAYNGVLLGEVSAKTAEQTNKIARKRGTIGKFISKGRKIENQMITMVI